MEQGRRLENLSWRLWNRETFCCETDDLPSVSSSTQSLAIASNSSEATLNSDLPDLSGSIDSLVSNETAMDSDDDEQTTATATPLANMRPHIVRQDSGSSTVSRGCERHINPCDLEKMISNIKHTSPETIRLQGTPEIPSKSSSQSITALIDEELVSPTNKAGRLTSFDGNHETQASGATVMLTEPTPSNSLATSSLKTVTSVIRGFTPVAASQWNATAADPVTTNVPISSSSTTNMIPHKKKPVAFAFGGSSQSDASFSASPSFKNTTNNIPLNKKKAEGKKPMFALGGSASGEDDSSLPSHPSVSPQRSSLASAHARPAASKKQTSFMEAVEERQIGDDNVFDDTEDEDDIDESAIDDDDDDCSEWEDDSPDDHSGSSSIDPALFQRVDSRPNLTSRRSMLTTLLHQNDRAAALSNAASRSSPSMYRSRNSSPAGPSLAASPDSDDASPLMMRTANNRPSEAYPRVQPIPMPRASSSSQNLALSPTTVRRTMFGQELTSSLRTNLLSERKFKVQTRDAHCQFLKRRAMSLKDIKEHPSKNAELDSRETRAGWNEYFDQDAGGYHSKGW